MTQMWEIVPSHFLFQLVKHQQQTLGLVSSPLSKAKRKSFFMDLGFLRRLKKQSMLDSGRNSSSDSSFNSSQHSADKQDVFWVTGRRDLSAYILWLFVQSGTSYMVTLISFCWQLLLLFIGNVGLHSPGSWLMQLLITEQMNDGWIWLGET